MLLKFNHDFILNDDINKSLFPIRSLLRNDELEEILKNPDLDIWLYFYANNSIKNIFSSKFYKPYDMALSFSYFLEIEITLQFIRDGCKDKIIIEVIEATRIALQNFLFCLDQGSFYTAFTEYRICIEGILWFYVIRYERNKIIGNRIDTIDNYSSLLKKYCNELYSTWRKICELIHQEKEIIHFNVNSIYEESDSNYLEIFMNSIKSTSGFFRECVNSLFDLFKNSIYIDRYKLLISYCDNTRKKYDIKDIQLMVKAKEKVEFPYEIQEKLRRNFYLEKNNEQIMELYKTYLYGLLNSTNGIDSYYKLEEENILYIIKLFDIDELFKDTMVSKRIENILHNKNVDNLSISYEKLFYGYCTTAVVRNLHPVNGMLVIQLILYSSMLFVEEIISEKKNINLAILRSYFEDAIYTISINKFEVYGLYNSLFYFLKKRFNFDLQKIDKNFFDKIKYVRHLTPFNRISYIGDEGRITGNKSHYDDLVNILIIILENLFPTIFDCNFWDENNNKNEFYIEFQKILSGG